MRAFIHAKLYIRKHFQQAIHASNERIVVVLLSSETIREHYDGVHARVRHAAQFSNLILKPIGRMARSGHKPPCSSLYHAPGKLYPFVSR